jgi:hypothetical protein
VNTNERVKELISERLKQGQDEYGQDIPLDGKDGRDNLLESLYEALDLAVYIAASILEVLDKREQSSEYIKRSTDDVEGYINNPDDGSWKGR